MLHGRPGLHVLLPFELTAHRNPIRQDQRIVSRLCRYRRSQTMDALCSRNL